MVERKADSSERVSSGGPGYATLVRGFAPRWPGTPRDVELCADAGQVRDAVQVGLTLAYDHPVLRRAAARRGRLGVGNHRQSIELPPGPA